MPTSGMDYTKAENIFQPVSAAYASMRLSEGRAFNYISVMGVPSDDDDKGSTATDGIETKELDEFTYGPTNGHIDAMWVYFYDIVSAANYAIESMAKFEEKKSAMELVADFINRKYGVGTCELTIRDSYFNMREKIEPCMYIVDRAKAAMKSVGMSAVTVPIRGGTDGARLSYMGLPCPNLCTGGENYHGRFEYIPVEDMELCTKLLVEILTNV